MNSKDVKNYWVKKYKEVLNKDYISENYILDLTLFKRLLKKYSEFVVLEAIDIFLESNASCKNIKYFSNTAFFEDNFIDLINEQEAVKYKRLYKNNTEAQELIDEYKYYVNTISLSDSEKQRRLEILEKLKGLEKDFEPTRA